MYFSNSDFSTPNNYSLMLVIDDSSFVAFTINFKNTDQCSVTNMLMLLLEKLIKNIKNDGELG